MAPHYDEIDERLDALFAELSLYPQTDARAEEVRARILHLLRSAVARENHTGVSAGDDGISTDDRSG